MRSFNCLAAGARIAPPLPSRSTVVTALPSLLIALAAALGIYTRLKLARSMIKAVYLIVVK